MIENGQYGVVTASADEPYTGTRITVTVKPDSGYELDELTVTDAKGKEVKVTKRSETTYTFQMPEARSRWKLPLPRRERWWISLCSPT